MHQESRKHQPVASSERTEPGTGGAKTPAREPTAHGVGGEQTAQAPAAPIIAVAPTREKTVLGVGAPEPARQRAPRAAQPSVPEPPPEDGWESSNEEQAAAEPESPPVPERSLPIELVATKAKVEPPAPSEASLVAAGMPRRRSRAWPAVLVVLLAAGCAAYVFRARIPWVQRAIDRGAALIAPTQPIATPPPQPSAQPLASAPAPAATPSASLSVSSAPVASASPSVSAKPAKRSSPKAPSSPSFATKAGDNPY